ncbi:high light inducible protein [Nostoc sp. C117]|uniref:high light inducible protein n=1 Tax=Nostoc sp. C117 TaxID=3349875 RepID=UPI00370D9F0F
MQKIFIVIYILLYINKNNEQKITGRDFSINERGQVNGFAIDTKVYVVDASSDAGFTEYTEKIDRRLPMLASLIPLEVMDRHGLIGWVTSH